jgi:hypothetical protein
MRYQIMYKNMEYVTAVVESLAKEVNTANRKFIGEGVD